MKTTEKYADKVKQIAMSNTSTSETQETQETQDNETSSPAPYPRDIVLMRIRHILKSAQDVVSS